MSKKTFKAALSAGSAITNPAEALITGAASTPPLQAPSPAPEAAAVSVAVMKESKTRRLQSLIRPSLYDYLKRSALRKGISVNDRLNAILEEAKAGEEA